MPPKQPKRSFKVFTTFNRNGTLIKNKTFKTTVIGKYPKDAAKKLVETYLTRNIKQTLNFTIKETTPNGNHKNKIHGPYYGFLQSGWKYKGFLQRYKCKSYRGCYIPVVTKLSSNWKTIKLLMLAHKDQNNIISQLPPEILKYELIPLLKNYNFLISYL